MNSMSSGDTFPLIRGHLPDPPRREGVPSVFSPLKKSSFSPLTNKTEPVTILSVFRFEATQVWSRFMGTLRERKKLRTQDSIIQAAAKLFNSKGYNETTVEEIAEKADVGVGTLYNYFTSKRGLLAAWMWEMHSEAFEQGKAVVEAEVETDDPEKVISDLICVYMDDFLNLDRDIMREIWAASIAEPDSFGKDMARMDYQLIEQLTSLIKNFQDSGRMNPNLPPSQAAIILFSAIMLLVLEYMVGHVDSGETIKETISSNISLIFQDWRGNG